MYKCICIYVYMCICVYVYMCICAFVYMRMYVFIYTRFIFGHICFLVPLNNASVCVFLQYLSTYLIFCAHEYMYAYMHPLV